MAGLSCLRPKVAMRTSAKPPSEPTRVNGMASAVFAQLRANYPADSIGWIKGIRWVLAEIPLDLVDFSSEHAWAAYHQRSRVEHFARELKAGRAVDPAVAIIRPGHNHIRVIDGHHRTLACKKAGQPIRAYVGYLNGDPKAAYETHLYQEHQGNSPQNKSAAEPYVAGLMVRAADTGRVLMLQRAITEDDPAAGRWEPPGGHAETGETLLQAALREFSEETGCVSPRGTLTGSWNAANGIYRGYVITVPSEDAVDIEGGRDQVVNPDGDSFEALAWFDPGQFAANPSMRDEMAADLPAVMAALGGEMAGKMALNC